jgi:hypothetical protein
MVRFFDSDGVEQANAPISLLKQIDSNSRERDAQLLLQQVRALDATTKLELVRADAAIERARADAAEAASHSLIASQVERLQDQALRLIHRVDSYERRAARREIDSLPDPEAADTGDPATAGTADLQTILGPSEPADRQQLESILDRGREDGAAEPAGSSNSPLRLDVPASSGITLAPPDERADQSSRDRKLAALREMR